MCRVLYNVNRVINDGRVWCILCDREGPKTLLETENDGVDKCLVRMCGEKGFKVVNVDWHNELEEMWMITNCSECNRTVQFIGRRCR